MSYPRRHRAEPTAERRGTPGVIPRPHLRDSRGGSGKNESKKGFARAPLSSGDLLALQSLAGNQRVAELLSKRSGPKPPDRNRVLLQRFVVLASKQNPVPIENGVDPRGQIYVFGMWRQFQPARWETELQYRNWVWSGWNESPENALPEPQPVLNPTELGMVLARIQEMFALQERIRNEAVQLPQSPAPQLNLPHQPVGDQEAAMEAEQEPAPQLTVTEVGENDTHVLDEVEEWQSYVERALLENPAGETLWQLQSSRTVLESIRANLDDMINEGEDDHDFDIARSVRGIESIIDTTRENDTFSIENIATNPRNLYTLHGNTPQQRKGAGSALIRNLVALALKEGDARIELVALSSEHARRYEKMGFQLDRSKLSSTTEGDLSIPTSEIPMVAAVTTLKSHFGL
jgi:hypothetical protein